MGTTPLKHLLRVAVIAATLTITTAGVSQAQTAPRVYENGSVWQISYIQTKPGMFNDYMAYLSGQWRQSNELRKRAGDVLSYKVLSVNSPGDNAPDMILMVEYKNMAVLDRTQAELDKQTAEVFGSTVKASQSQVSREAMRIQRGGVLTRELTFSK